MKTQHPKPRVVVSKCLGFAACRWNGDIVSDPQVEVLAPWVEFLPVCPEMEIGLGAPRKPVRLVEVKGKVSLLQHDTGRDCTEDMERFCRDYLAALSSVDGFIFKGRSPSCGPNDVKIHLGPKKGAAIRKGAGLFGGAVKESLGHLAVEHEGRLKNLSLREHFFTKLFTMARFRQVRDKGGVGGLVEFQAENKLLFMAYNQSQAKLLGRITANPQKLLKEEVFEAYAAVLPKVLARPMRPGSAINTLMHAMGYFRKELNSAEKAHFLENLEDYRQGKLPLSALLVLLTSWVARFGEPYLAKQSFFAPYPSQLVNLASSGWGRVP